MSESFRLSQVAQFSDTRHFVYGRGSVALLVEEVEIVWLPASV